MIHGTIEDLTRLLDLEPAGRNEFRAAPLADPRSRVYGGQFLGQGLAAAARIRSGVIRSFHCYYIRAGSTDTPLTYRAEPTGDSLVWITALQQDKVLFSMDVAFGDYAGVPAGAAAVMPAVPAPLSCIPREEGISGLDTNTDSTWAVVDSPFDYRFAENIWEDGFHAPGHNVWFRARDAMVNRPTTQALTQAMVAYFSDDPIMDNALFPHGWHRCWTELQTASLDHAMWFHAPLDLSSWLLFAQDSPVGAGGRAMARGRMFDADGALLASVCQEILMRTPSSP